MAIEILTSKSITINDYISELHISSDNIIISGHYICGSIKLIELILKFINKNLSVLGIDNKVRYKKNSKTFTDYNKIIKPDSASQQFNHEFFIDIDNNFLKTDNTINT